MQSVEKPVLISKRRNNGVAFFREEAAKPCTSSETMKPFAALQDSRTALTGITKSQFSPLDLSVFIHPFSMRGIHAYVFKKWEG
jgi:hypothetical protein